MSTLVTEWKYEIHTQLVSLVKEDDWDLFLRTFPLPLVTGSVEGRFGARSLILRWRALPLLPLAGGFGSSLGPHSPPEGFRPSWVLRMLG